MNAAAATGALFVLALCACDANPPPSGAMIREHMEALATDALQGREAGTEGHLVAARYVAESFSGLGLAPAAGDGSFFHQVPLLESRLVPGSEALRLHRDGTTLELEPGQDFVTAGGFGEARERLRAPLLFVGYGIQAPEYGHDDFAGVNPAGSILVQFTGAPPGFAHDERAYYSSADGKQALAVRLGARGIITIRTPVDRQRLTWERVRHSAAGSGMRWLDAGGAAHEGHPQLLAHAMLSDQGAAQLFALAGRDLEALFVQHDAGDTGAFALGVEAHFERRSTQRRVTSPNVLALLPGSDPELRGEYLLFSAHLDHLGADPGGQGDVIYNGAYDNAAGVATLLEVAAALARTRPAPRRSILFAAVTAEEKGLRGSDYLAHHPPVAIGSIVANINIDMPYLGFPAADVEGYGADHSTLHDTLALAAGEHGLALTPDRHPELVRLIRSDQYSFVRQHVPGLNLKPGTVSADPAVDGTGQVALYLHEHYHARSDELGLPYSEEGATRFARVALSLGLRVANADERPRWREGDFFGERFRKADVE